jgi:hypothetical protein
MARRNLVPITAREAADVEPELPSRRGQRSVVPAPVAKAIRFMQDNLAIRWHQLQHSVMYRTVRHAAASSELPGHTKESQSFAALDMGVISAENGPF